MRIVKLSILVCLIAFLVAFLFFKKEAIACEVAPFSHFEQIQPNVYVDSSLTNTQRTSLINKINHAYQRVHHVYGETSSPSRIIATNDTEYKRFGLNLTGMQNSGFFTECIFLGPKGMNVDVIAHELVHAEVRYRTNLFVEYTQLPAWFIEGTGIKVDYRAPFLIENIEVSHEEVAQIKSVFFLRDFSNTSIRSYQAARVAIEALDPKTLYSGLARLNNGEKFEDVFGLPSNEFRLK